jgi:hypothetical protein
MVTKVATVLASGREKTLEIEEAPRHRVCYAVGMRWVWCAIFPVLLGGCLSPTLPLPPPSPPTENAGTEPNTIILTGTADPDAVILIVNNDPMFESTDAGEAQCNGAPNCQVAATRADNAGNWTATVFAVKNDILEISEQIGDEQSPSIDFEVLIN